MNKITIIYGPEDVRSGKSRLAKDLTTDLKTVWFTARHRKFLENPFWTDPIEKDTEVIVFDDVIASNIKGIREVMSYECITVNKQSKAPFTINIPDIIITIGCDKSDLRPIENLLSIHHINRFKTIHLETIDDYYRESDSLVFNMKPKLILTTNYALNEND